LSIAPLIVGVALICCTGNQRDAAPDTEAPAVEPLPPPYEPPAGAVLSVTTSLSSNAPAATLDHAAWLRLRLDLEDGRTAEWSTPLGGDGVWFIDGARGTGRLAVELFSPSNRRVAFNTTRTSELQGLVGHLAFEVSPSGAERLSDIRGLDHAGLYWRTGGRTLVADDEPLLLTARAGLDAETMASRLRDLGVEPQSSERASGVWHWTVVSTQGTAIDVARRLARSPEITGIALVEAEPQSPP